MKPLFKGEQIIPLKKVRFLNIFEVEHTYREVKRWRTHGTQVEKADGTKEVVYLQCKREGSRIFTSVEAVQRFINKTNGGR